MKSPPADVEGFTAAVADAPSAPAPTRTAAARGLELQQDEIIQLTVRPSPWCIPLYSGRLLIALVLLAAAVLNFARPSSAFAVSAALLVLVLLTFVGVVAATLQWASQLYVLTNRRVLRFRGLFSVQLAECPLAKIERVELIRQWYHPPLRLGSVRMTARSPVEQRMDWEHLSRPEEVHSIISRAVHGAGPR